MKTARIICAANVSDASYAYLCGRLTERFGEIRFERETDPALLGGFQVLLDGVVYDLSLRTQLDALHRQAAE